jgi:hypothetical protein
MRACAAITLCRDFVIVGSQAILGEHPDRLFLADLRAAGLADEQTLLARAAMLPEAERTRVITAIRRDFRTEGA